MTHAGWPRTSRPGSSAGSPAGPAGTTGPPSARRRARWAEGARGPVRVIAVEHAHADQGRTGQSPHRYGERAMSEQQLWTLLRHAEELPYGPARTALVEQAMSEADAAGPHPLRYHARLAATNCYVYGGEPAKSFDTFYWGVAEYDRDPAAHQETPPNLLRQFKGTVTRL